MKTYLAFTKKELLEYTRTYKLFLMVIIFLGFGFMNPVTAKYTPELIAGFMPEGMSVEIAEPTILDSWSQFFSNIPQLGLIIMVIVFSGLMANEFSKGTLVNILTKGMRREAVILAKFTSASLIWTVSYLVSFVVTLLYSKLFWSDTGVANLAMAVGCVWLFGILLLSSLLLGGILFRSSYGSLLFVGVLVVVMFVLNVLQTIAEYVPIRLVSVNMELLRGSIGASEVYAAVGITIGLTVVFIVISMVVFNRKRL